MIGHRPRGRHPAAALVVILAVTACAPTPAGIGPPASAAPATPAATATPSVGSAAEPVALTVEVGPRPGPVKPFRGEMTQEVRIADGYASMYFELRNTGEEPVTFLNTLYDYEPRQLYQPVVRLEWQEGGNAVYTRNGRFFPSPAILQPGETGYYLLGGEPIAGTGTVGDLVTHIKYCPTRGMDDLPSLSLAVSDLAWTPGRDGSVTVTGTLTAGGTSRDRPPTVGVAFFDASGHFVGAVVGSAVGEPIDANASRTFELAGNGVDAAAIARAEAYAYVS
jgi:hypothetical protein